MEKAFVKKVLAVLLGVSLVILVYETASLIVAAALFDDLQIFENSLNDLEAFIKWSAVALACMLIPALASYVFAFFGKNKLFVLISAALSLIVTICCIAFFCMARVYAMQGFSSSSYAQGAEAGILPIIFLGQAVIQAPHEMHLSGSTCASLPLTLIASSGQTALQSPQPRHA